MVLGCIDSTTTEVCDLLMGGVFSAGEDRLGAFARSGLPYVVFLRRSESIRVLQAAPMSSAQRSTMSADA